MILPLDMMVCVVQAAQVAVAVAASAIAMSAFFMMFSLFGDQFALSRLAVGLDLDAVAHCFDQIILRCDLGAECRLGYVCDGL
jgi:hypothetical protein